MEVSHEQNLLFSFANVSNIPTLVNSGREQTVIPGYQSASEVGIMISDNIPRTLEIYTALLSLIKQETDFVDELDVLNPWQLAESFYKFYNTKYEEYNSAVKAGSFQSETYSNLIKVFSTPSQIISDLPWVKIVGSAFLILQDNEILPSPPFTWEDIGTFLEDFRKSLNNISILSRLNKEDDFNANDIAEIEVFRQSILQRYNL
jgi:hypothetical protein